jgi:aldose 1-epimerase
MIEWMLLIGATVCGVCLAGCAATGHFSNHSSSISKKPFGTTSSGEAVEMYTLRNNNGAEAHILTYGGILTSLKMPDKHGHYGDVVLGYDYLDGYLTNSPYFGALIGRYGNRIAKGKFTLDGVTYTLATNNYPNALHGGNKGFDKVIWTVEKADVGPDGPRLQLHYFSKDGEEGYPGNLNVTAVYTLTQDNGLRLDYTATTDKDTIINLTHHSYFNLAGRGDVLSHEVYINADKFTPVDSTSIPTGEIRPVDGTPFDFRTPTAIGARINDNNEQLKFTGGYDHNFVINKPAGRMDTVARVYDPSSGRVLEVFSTEPGVQFYTGNFLDGTITGKGGWVYEKHDAFCLEPQHYPDSPNHPNFPSVVLHPGQTYRNTILYLFSVKK